MWGGRSVTQEVSGIRVSVSKGFVPHLASNQEVFSPTKQQNGTSASQQYGWEHTQDGQPENRGPSQGEKPSHSLEKTHFQLPTAGFTPSLSHHLCHDLPTFTSSFCQNKNLPLMNQIQGYCHQHRYCGWIVGSWQLDNYELVIG